MPLLKLSAADFASLLRKLAPRGELWNGESSSVLQQVYLALGGTFARLNDRANDLVTEAFPATTVELLPEWEASLGLPDPCSGPDTTIEQRQAHVVARLVQQEGPTIPSLTAFALSLGFTITIQEFTPRRFGQPFGTPYYGVPWAFTWRVIAPTVEIRPRRFQDYFGEPYASWSSRALECELRRLAPAHTQLVFTYTATLGQFILGQNSLGADAPLPVADADPNAWNSTGWSSGVWA